MSLERQQLYIDLVTNQLTILKYFKTIVDKFDSPKLENTHLPITVLLKNAQRKTNREERHIISTNIFGPFISTFSVNLGNMMLKANRKFVHQDNLKIAQKNLSKIKFM